VQNLKIAYKGQNPMRLVSKKIAATTKKMVPRVPVTVPVKYKIAIRPANSTLAILSALPMLCFIVFFLGEIIN